jgi:hypothetical protein
MYIFLKLFTKCLKILTREQFGMCLICRGKYLHTNLLDKKDKRTEAWFKAQKHIYGNI